MNERLQRKLRDLFSRRAMTDAELIIDVYYIVEQIGFEADYLRAIGEVLSSEQKGKVMDAAWSLLADEWESFEPAPSVVVIRVIDPTVRPPTISRAFVKSLANWRVG